MNEIKVTATKKRTRRRGNGEGSIYQHPDGRRWVAMISVGYDASGKRKRRVIYGKNQTEVREKLTRLQSSKLDGMLCEASKITVSAFLTRWLDDVKRPELAATTLANYRGIAKNHIGPIMGGTALTKLTPQAVQWLYAEMERKGASKDTRRLAHEILHGALDKAVEWDMLPRNPCDRVSPPKIDQAEVQFLPEEQARALLAAADGDRLEALYVLAIGSGLRLGELFALQWSDVDLKKGTVTVRHTLQELNGKLTLKEPKTKKSRRQVDLGESVVTALVEHRKRMLAAGQAAIPWVFCNLSGGPLRRSHFHRADFKPLLERAGLPSIHFHALRHTSASLMARQGVHPKVMQERLGHSQISVTMDIYSHVMEGMGREAANKLDTILTTKPKPLSAATA